MKRFRQFICVMLCALLATGCASAPNPPASQTLPPVFSGGEAPLGDAGLRHETIAVMYLPAHDGQNLLAFYENLELSYEQHPAETILRALLSHEGNTRVRPLGGHVTLSLTGANPVEVSGGVCTVNLSASALQLPLEDLYTAVLAIAATLCESEDISYVNVLVAGTPVAMDVSGCLPLGSLTSQLGQELPVLWEQLSARRAPVGVLPSETPLTAVATLYFPLTEGGICAETRRLTFPGQDPQQIAETLLAALTDGADDMVNAADMPDLPALLLFPPEVTELDSGGRRLTLHFTADVKERITAQGTDPAACFASIVCTLTTFIPSLQQVCILTGEGALTSLYSPALGSMLFPGGLHARTDYAHALMAQSTVYVPSDGALEARTAALPYRSAVSPRAILLHLAQSALPEGLTDADILGLSVDGDTLIVNLSARYADVLRQHPDAQRLAAYAMVNTLCERLSVRRTRFFFNGETIDTLDGPVLWSGEFIYNPGLISPE